MSMYNLLQYSKGYKKRQQEVYGIITKIYITEIEYIIQSKVMSLLTIKQESQVD